MYEKVMFGRYSMIEAYKQGYFVASLAFLRFLVSKLNVRHDD